MASSDKKWAAAVVVHSVRTTAVAIASFLVARLCRLPEAYWAPITALVITQSSLGAALTVSRQRLVGTVLGAGANVFGAATHPKFVAPFSWGEREPYATFHASKFIDVAERMMQRRGVQLGDALRRHLARAHARATNS